MRNRVLGAGALAALLSVMAAVADDPVELRLDQYKRTQKSGIEAALAGRATGAIEALKAYQADSPDDPETWFALGVAHAHAGDRPAAVSCLKGALDNGLPPGRLAAEARNLLAPLQGYHPFTSLLRENTAALVHGPMIGRVTANTASFWVRTAREATVRVHVTNPSDGVPVASSAARTSAEKDYTAVIPVSGLEPGTRYAYELSIDGEPYAGAPSWSCQTFPEPGAPAAFSVGFGGGAGYVPWNEHVWDIIRGCGLTAFLFLGDNVYIDKPDTPEIQNYCYYRRQSRPEFRRFTGAVPIFAIWDDHDFGTNDCWGGPDLDSFPWKPAVWEVFKHNWANPPYGGGPGQPGCWFDATIGDVQFFFLDGRFYRTDPKQPSPTMLGPAQRKWLLTELAQSTGTFKVLASPVPWTPGVKPGSLDTWDGYPEEREAIFSLIEEQRIPGVILLAADRHRSDAWLIERPNGYPFYEFESSRITNQHVHDRLEGALFSYNELQSFGILTFDTTKADPEVTYAIVNINGEEVYRLTVPRSRLQYPATW